MINFLSAQQGLGKSYSTINSYRSGLSSVLPPMEGFPVGKHPMVIRLLKGIFNANPPKPRYQSTWEVSRVLDYLCSMAENYQLSLFHLSQKLVSLVALVTAQRTQTLNHLDISFMHISDDRAVFQVMDVLKTTTPKKGIAKQIVELPSFPSNKKLCVLLTLKEYLNRTKPLRECHGETKLFISTRKPHKSVTSSTLARWLKFSLFASGIDTSVFSAHSFRSAATSSAFAHGVTLKEIMKKADWSNARTFKTFYHKPVVEDGTFAFSVLAQAS